MLPNELPTGFGWWWLALAYVLGFATPWTLAVIDRIIYRIRYRELFRKGVEL